MVLKRLEFVSKESSIASVWMEGCEVFDRGLGCVVDV